MAAGTLNGHPLRMAIGTDMNAQHDGAFPPSAPGKRRINRLGVIQISGITVGRDKDVIPWRGHGVVLLALKCRGGGRRTFLFFFLDLNLFHRRFSGT